MNSHAESVLPVWSFCRHYCCQRCPRRYYYLYVAKISSRSDKGDELRVCDLLRRQLRYLFYDLSLTDSESWSRQWHRLRYQVPVALSEIWLRYLAHFECSAFFQEICRVPILQRVPLASPCRGDLFGVECWACPDLLWHDGGDGVGVHVMWNSPSSHYAQQQAVLLDLAVGAQRSMFPRPVHWHFLSWTGEPGQWSQIWVGSESIRGELQQLILQDLELFYPLGSMETTCQELYAPRVQPDCVTSCPYYALCIPSL